MAHIIIMGAGLGGMPAAYEMRELLPKEHQVTVVSAVDYFQFVPSNPWVAVGWRSARRHRAEGGPAAGAQGHQVHRAGRSRASTHPANQITLADGQTLAYDYLVITTGPKLSFDEVPGPLGRMVATPTRCARWTMPRPSGPTTRSS